MEINSFLPKKRLFITGIITAALFVYIMGRFTVLAFSPLRRAALEPPVIERGSIMDRNGKPLAVQTNFYHLAATPPNIRDLGNTADVLAPLINMHREDIIAAISSAGNRPYTYIKRKIDEREHDAVANAIKEHRLSGLYFDQIPGRIYPENSLAAQLIGFMGDDGEGLAGIEYSMQSVLAAQPVQGDTIDMHGKNIYLTIDANLQYKLEQIAQDSMKNTQAESMMLVAAEAKTGEILSYISLPSSDLNQYPESNPAERIDRPAMSAYEPGSVFKIFSVASFIDAKAVSPNDTFVCDGVYEIRTSKGEYIRITCLGQHGTVTAREALEYSCNDALAQMSAKIDSQGFLDRLRAFGFGSRTGIELPGETAGSLKTVNDPLWSARSKPTISIGQEINVSALQMVHGATAFTNGGTPLKLSVISRVTDYDGTEIFHHEPEQEERIISPYTASYILSCMQTTAESGTGRRAALGDISIGVKTGTAQMPDFERGGYSDTDFLSNCIAVFPIDDPQIILYIVIAKAQGETYSGRIVAPIIAEAADAIIDHLGMARGDAASYIHSGTVSINREQSPVISNTVPDFTGMPKRRIAPLLSRTDIHLIINGDGWVVSQTPPAGTPVTENMTIELNLE